MICELVASAVSETAHSRGAAAWSQFLNGNVLLGLRSVRYAMGLSVVGRKRRVGQDHHE